MAAAAVSPSRGGAAAGAGARRGCGPQPHSVLKELAVRALCDIVGEKDAIAAALLADARARAAMTRLPPRALFDSWAVPADAPEAPAPLARLGVASASSTRGDGFAAAAACAPAPAAGGALAFWSSSPGGGRAHGDMHSRMLARCDLCMCRMRPRDAAAKESTWTLAFPRPIPLASVVLRFQLLCLPEAARLEACVGADDSVFVPLRVRGALLTTRTARACVSPRAARVSRSAARACLTARAAQELPTPRSEARVVVDPPVLARSLRVVMTGWAKSNKDKHHGIENVAVNSPARGGHVTACIRLCISRMGRPFDMCTPACAQAHAAGGRRARARGCAVYGNTYREARSRGGRRAARGAAGARAWGYAFPDARPL